MTIFKRQSQKMIPMDETQQRQTRDQIDFSQTNASTFPTITRPNIVIRMNASRNSISDLPNRSIFTRLRYLDLSSNNFQDLSPLGGLPSLLELDISNNFVQNLDFLRDLALLEVLHASNNKISRVICLPENLIDIDLSNNNLKSLEFLDSPNEGSNEPFPHGLERLNISGNNITQIISLRYITVFLQLRELDVGLLDANRNLQLLPFVKSLCPSLQTFDGADLRDVDEYAFNLEDLIQVLTSGSEQALRSFISGIETGIRWDPPTFIDYDDDTPPTPLKTIEDRLRVLEERVADDQYATPTKNKYQNQTATLISPYNEQDDNAVIAAMQNEINELKQQVAQIAEILYVHDRALRQLWVQ